MKTALIIGATGLVGSHLLDLLLNDARFEKIKVFTRRPTGIKHSKLEEIVTDFDKMHEWSHQLSGDVLFSALGTTIKKAGSKDTQYKIDFSYQYDVADHAKQNGVGTYVLVSSAGADPRSKVFYSRMKGELEEAISKLKFQNIRIIRPGILDGERSESRPMEKLAVAVSRRLVYMPCLKRFRPIHAETVAKAMINACFEESAGIRKYELEEVFTLASGS
jgi:uncharacterized protein YbjT (DUF2867 family)